jgi:hypothetical protein
MWRDPHATSGWSASISSLPRAVGWYRTCTGVVGITWRSSSSRGGDSELPQDVRVVTRHDERADAVLERHPREVVGALAGGDVQQPGDLPLLPYDVTIASAVGTVRTTRHPAPWDR